MKSEPHTPSIQQMFTVEICHLILLGETKNQLFSGYHEKMPTVGMWENQEPSEYSWIQINVDVVGTHPQRKYG